MDSASQTSAVDDEASFVRSCSSICLSDTTVGETNGSGCCAKDIVEKLMVQLKERDEKLKEKDEQLEKNKQEIMELRDKLDLEKAQNMQAKNATYELKTKLDMVEAKQMEYQQIILWKSFPLPHLCYYIKWRGFCLYADKAGNLIPSSDDRPFPCTGHFKFAKHPNGTFSIYSMSQEKYLECNGDDIVTFTANDYSKIGTKFELFLVQHKDKQLAAGISVDIRSLENGCFLSRMVQYSNMAANSSTAPSHKFLIIPMDGQ